MQSWFRLQQLIPQKEQNHRKRRPFWFSFFHTKICLLFLLFFRSYLSADIWTAGMWGREPWMTVVEHLYHGKLYHSSRTLVNIYQNNDLMDKESQGFNFFLKKTITTTTTLQLVQLCCHQILGNAIILENFPLIVTIPLETP